MLKGTVPDGTPLGEARKVAGAVVLGYGLFVTVLINTLILAFAVFLIFLLPAFTAPLVTTILGSVAVSQIGRSAGKLYGLGLAVVYDVCHNTAKLERHVVDRVARDLVVHRKGATRAFPAWSRLPGRERAKYLFRIARLLQDPRVSSDTLPPADRSCGGPRTFRVVRSFRACAGRPGSWRLAGRQQGWILPVII